MNPGPVNVTERVRKALLGADICHREPEFSRLLGDVRGKLLSIFGVRRSHSIAFFSGPGTSALESMLVSYAQRRRRVLVLSNGVYGERMRSILEYSGAPVSFLEAPLGRFPSGRAIEAALKAAPSIEAVAMVHHETSTGMLNPLEEAALAARKAGKAFIVDAISSLGGEKIDFAKTPIDYLVGNSGKCLHGFPGAAFVFLSKRAVAETMRSKPVTLALDLKTSLENAERGDTAFTPAVQIFYAFREALAELEEEGLSRRIAAYRARSLYIEKAAGDLGLRFLIEKPFRSHVLTALWTPEWVGYEKLHDRLKKEGFVIYAGQSRLKGKIFRIANLGDIRLKDLERFRSALGRALGRRPAGRG